nr:protein FANTASTIC FOUR 4 [Ipomoea trifida]
MPTTTAAASTVDDDDIRSADIDDDVGGNFDGLTSCTESSVGYEGSSSVELDEIVDDNDIKDSLSYSWRFRRTVEEKRKSKKFPPPLSSLTQDGKPTFFLLPVRKDGRLKLRQFPATPMGGDGGKKAAEEELSLKYVFDVECGAFEDGI